jgi:hypothetical protein
VSTIEERTIQAVRDAADHHAHAIVSHAGAFATCKLAPCVMFATAIRLHVMAGFDRKQPILDAFETAMAKVMYYDRKEDAALPVGSIEEALKMGVVNVDEILAVVLRELGQATEVE